MVDVWANGADVLGIADHEKVQGLDQPAADLRDRSCDNMLARTSEMGLFVIVVQWRWKY